MTAYFIDLKNGSLIRTQQWRTRARRNLMETKESEARIYPLSGSRYVVMAGGILYLYDARGNQLFEKTLAVGMWSMQPVSGGNELVLRYEKAQQKISSDGISRDVEYSWLDSHDMTVQATLKDRDFDRSQTGMTASGRLLIYPDSNGLHTLSISNVDRLVCTEEYCKEPVLDEVEATAYGLAVGSRMGFGVIPMSNKSKSWFLSVWPNGDLDRITVLPIVTSPEAQTLAAYVARGKKYRMFDGEKLSLDEELFVYRTADGKRLAIVPGADCAFSPDGSKLVSFDGRDLRLYAIDASD